MSSDAPSTQPAPQAAPPKSRHSGALLILAAGAALCAVILCVTYGIRSCVRAPADTAVDLAKQVSSGIKDLLNITPRVTVNQVVVIHESYPSFELATVTRETSATYEYRNQQYLSEKSLTLKGRFRLKAGFDLSQSGSLDVDRGTLKIKAKFPPPKILSVELLSQEVEKSENGYWNKLTPADQKEALDKLLQTAKAEGGAGILGEAKKNLEERLKTIVEKHGSAIHVEYVK